MRRFASVTAALTLTLVACQKTESAPADSPAAASAASSLPADLAADVGQVQKKIVDLAREIPADKYNWRPAPDVRSISKVLLHVTADNYLMAGAMGHAIDPSAGIANGDWAGAEAFESRALAKDSVIAEVEKSFAFVNSALSGTLASRLGESVTMFGQNFTLQQAWILAATHVHEHLGQLIAYARSIGVKPPWN